LEVTVNGKDVEKALRDLKRKIQRDGIFQDLKKRRFYEKPSLKKKRKQREARKRKAKALRMGNRQRSR
jgi:small subunit ribosomal protein S21